MGRLCTGETKQMKLTRANPFDERFFCYFIEVGGCWNWRGYLNNNGYGTISIDGVEEYAHRASWMFFFGKIPEGMCVLHHCDNPSCVRPDHLFLGTMSDNSKDMWRKGRHPICAGRPSSSGVKGVLWSPNNQKWLGIISRGYKKKSIYVGLYATIAEAQKAVEEKRSQL
jgi:hypothetical protein